MPSLPLVVVAPAGPSRDRVLSALSRGQPEAYETVEGFHGREGEGWGILLLGPGLPPDQVLVALLTEVDRETPWSSIMVVEEGESFRLQPISVSHPVHADRVVAAAADPEGNGPLHEIHWVLRLISRARHDLNNPLTSGLAETQLLLMEEHPPEVKDALETIQQQLRRLRDMVAGLSNLRVRKAEAPPRDQS